MRQWVAAAKSDIDSFLFIGEQPGDQAGEVLTRTGDGTSFLKGVPQHAVNDESNTGAVYLVSAADLDGDGSTEMLVASLSAAPQQRSTRKSGHR